MSEQTNPPKRIVPVWDILKSLFRTWKDVSWILMLVICFGTMFTDLEPTQTFLAGVLVVVSLVFLGYTFYRRYAILKNGSIAKGNLVISDGGGMKRIAGENVMQHYRYLFTYTVDGKVYEHEHKSVFQISKKAKVFHVYYKQHDPDHSFIPVLYKIYPENYDSEEPILG